MNDLADQFTGVSDLYDTNDVNSIIFRITDAIARRDVDAAEIDLQRLQKMPDLDRLQQMQVENIERELQTVKTGRIRALEEGIKAALARKPVSPQDVEEAQRLLVEIDKIAPQHPSLGEWSGRLAEERKRIGRELEVPAIQAEVERRFRDAEQQMADGLYGPGLIALYDQVVQYVQGKRAQIDDVRLQTLEQKAVDNRANIREKHFILGTRALLGEFRELLQSLESLPDDDTVAVHRNPFAREEEIRNRLEPMRVSDARALVQRQARDYAAGKAREYADIAQKHLDEHNPEQALNQVKEAQALYGLDQEQQNRLQVLLDSQVLPALNKRNQARAALEEAARIANPLRKWDKLVEVQQIDPYVPGLRAEQESVKPGIKDYIDGKLNGVREALEQQPPNWKEAEKQLGELRELAERTGIIDIQDKIDRLASEVERWRQLEAEIEQAIQDAKRASNVDPVRALEELKKRVAAWGDRSKRYDDLTLELTRLGAHANAAEVLDRLAAMLSSADRKAVEQAVVECKEAAEANVVRRADFIALAGRLQLHHDFLIGVALVERPNRTSREEADGLELLERVVYGQDVDRDRAQAIIARVKADVSRAQARKAAIDKATEMRSQKRFKDAHQVLLEYRNDPEIAPLLVQNAEEWEKVLVAQVMTTLMRAPLDCRGARDLISDLETVGSREVGKLRSLVEGRCAEQRASVLEKEPGHDQDEIVQIWQDALASDPDNPMYKQRLRVASKRRDYSRNQEKVDPAEKAEAMRLMTKQYAGDLEVQVWYIDALVDLVSKQTEYVQVEEAAQRTEEALQVTMQQMVSAGADDGMRRGLEERRRKITRMKDIARRKHDIVLELKPDKQLEAWLRAKSEGAKLVNDFEDELAIRTWWERTRQYAFRDAESRLSHSGGDVWKELQPAAQMLALDGDNNTARTVLQKANRAIMDFPQQLRLAVNDTTGASYAGEARNKLDQQILAATDLRNNMMLARDILTTFGGVFDNAVDLKDQVSGYINQTTELIARLEDVRKQIHQGYAAIDQARSTEGAWYAYDQAQQRLEKLGYSQHLTVLEMDREKREVQGKQRNLKTVRENLVKAVRDSRTDEALRFAQQMVGAPPDVIAERKHLQVTVQDLRADPTDEFGEQRRIEVVEPFSGERFTALPELVRHLLRQSQQAAMILQWLPTNPTDTEDQVRIQVVSWPVVKAEASETAKAGKFDQARAQIEQAIDGDAQGNVGERLSLGAAVRYLNNPPVTREKLLSGPALALYEHGVRLFHQTRDQRDEALTMLKDLEKWQSDWDDAWQRLEAQYNYLGDLRGRPTGWLGKFGRGNGELEAARAQAREAYNRCLELCPNFPGIEDYSNI